MKKIVVLALVIACLFTLVGCGTEDSSVDSTAEEVGIKINEYKEVEIEHGNIIKVEQYYLFSTTWNEEYLMFLNQLGKDKYELIDISHSHSYFYVTYKEISE